MVTAETVTFDGLLPKFRVRIDSVPQGRLNFRLVQIRFSVGQLAHEAFTDLERLGKTVERRARVQPCRKQPVRLTALQAAEKG
jgi:hypothetical protein